MLEYNQITPKEVIIYEGEPWAVIDSQVSRKQQRKPVNQTKLKNKINGRVIDVTFHVSDKVKEADLSVQPITFLYFNPKKDEYWFSDTNDPSKRFTLSKNILGDPMQYITEDTALDADVWINDNDEEQIIGIRYPAKVELAVTQAPPGIKGDTATSGTKIVTLETGATTTTPLFVNVGDIIAVTTESGEYSTRVSKA